MPPIKTHDGRLTSFGRKELGAEDFALKDGEKPAGVKGRYPIQDLAHARNALARGAQHASPQEYAEIREKVKKKFPQIEQGRADREHEKRNDAKAKLDAYRKAAHQARP